MGLIKLAAIGAAGYAAYKYITREKAELAVAGNHVRDAGPENMKHQPKSWSKTDEAIDESFPASDPPSTY